MWLYTFEDGSTKQMKATPNGQPLSEDQLMVSDGYLSIIKYEDGKFLEFYQENWTELETFEGY